MKPDKFDYLVVDTNALIRHGYNLEYKCTHLITTPEIMEEYKTQEIELPVELHVPSADYIDKINEIATDLGDDTVLSQQDMLLCALALEFKCKYEKLGKVITTLTSHLTEEERQAFSPEELQRKRVKRRQERVTVACMTDDYAMQNVLHVAQVCVEHSEGMKISHVRKTMMRCYGCHTLQKQSTVFCEACGHATLSRVVVSEENGEMKVHLNDKWQYYLRGNVYSAPQPQAYRVNGNGREHRVHPHSQLFHEAYKGYIGRSADDPIYLKQQSNYEKSLERSSNRCGFLDEDKYIWMNKPKVQGHSLINASRKLIHKNKKRD